MLERRMDDYWNIEGIEIYHIRRLDSHESQYWMKNLQTDTHGPVGGWQSSKQHPVLTACGQNVATKRKAEVSYRKNRSLTMLEGCEGFTSLIQQMRSSKKQFKMRVESWKFRCQQQCLARSGDESTRKLVALPVLARKIRMHRWSRRIYEKAFGRNSSYRSWRAHCRERNQLVEPLQSRAQVYSHAQSNENTRCESSSGQIMGNTRENNSMAADKKVRNKKEGDRWYKERRQNSARRVINGHLSSWEFGAGTSASKVQRQGRTPRWHRKRWFWCVRSIHRTRFICVTNHGSKNNGCHCKVTSKRRTSSRRSISLHPGQNGRCSHIV